MSKFDEPDFYNREELLDVETRPPSTGWMDTPVDFRRGNFIYPGKAKNLKILDLPDFLGLHIQQEERPGVIGVCDPFTVRRPFGLLVEAAPVQPDPSDFPLPILRSDVELVLTRRIGDVGHRSPVGGPSRAPLVGAHGASDIPDIPFLRRDRHDLPPKLEDRSSSRW